jgi:hypothetical protein
LLYSPGQPPARGHAPVIPGRPPQPEGRRRAKGHGGSSGRLASVKQPQGVQHDQQ